MSVTEYTIVSVSFNSQGGDSSKFLEEETELLTGEQARQDLIKGVNDMLGQGWQPHGAIAEVCNVVFGDTGVSQAGTVMQAMVKVG